MANGWRQRISYSASINNLINRLAKAETAMANVVTSINVVMSAISSIWLMSGGAGWLAAGVIRRWRISAGHQWRNIESSYPSS